MFTFSIVEFESILLIMMNFCYKVYFISCYNIFCVYAPHLIWKFVLLNIYFMKEKKTHACNCLNLVIGVLSFIESI